MGLTTMRLYTLFAMVAALTLVQAGLRETGMERHSELPMMPMNGPMKRIPTFRGFSQMGFDGVDDSSNGQISRQDQEASSRGEKLHSLQTSNSLPVSSMTRSGPSGASDESWKTNFHRLMEANRQGAHGQQQSHGAGTEEKPMKHQEKVDEMVTSTYDIEDHGDAIRQVLKPFTRGKGRDTKENDAKIREAHRISQWLQSNGDGYVPPARQHEAARIRAVLVDHLTEKARLAQWEAEEEARHSFTRGTTAPLLLHLPEEDDAQDERGRLSTSDPSHDYGHFHTPMQPLEISHHKELDNDESEPDSDSSHQPTAGHHWQHFLQGCAHPFKDCFGLLRRPPTSSQSRLMKSHDKSPLLPNSKALHFDQSTAHPGPFSLARNGDESDRGSAGPKINIWPQKSPPKSKPE